MNENTTTTATVSPEPALRFAAINAQQAPSIFNTQPWRWQINLPRLRLYADRTRQLRVADPDGRLLTISCGAALHHARIVLATTGTEITVKLLPDGNDADLLAEIEPAGAHHISPNEINMFAAIGDRHTDRRAFTAEPVEPMVLARLRGAAETNGAHLHVLRGADLGSLASAVAKAGEIELGDGAYRMELADWTHRPSWSGDGIPPATAVASHRRGVPVRDFSPFEPAAGSPGTGDDKGAVFVIIFTDTDDTTAWLNAGQALSAVLLTATDAGLASAPMTDVVETTVTRETLRRQLLAGIGHPQVCVRIGHSASGSPAASPRRNRLESIQIGQSIEEDMS